MSGFDLFDEGALFDRLTNSLRKREREVILIVGSPFSAPSTLAAPGVPGVDGMIQIIRNEFDGEPDSLRQLEQIVANSADNRYQEAFRFLYSRRGQGVANELVRTAVLSACDATARHRADRGDDQSFQLLEAEDHLWAISPGTLALAELTIAKPSVFGRAILTTNFDPLIEVAISRLDGKHYRTIMQGDGNLSITHAPGCQVVHLHGYWYGSTTLHTARQLSRARPELEASLSRLIRNRLVVVCGYGGWDDVFTTTLLSVVADDADDTEILWSTFAGPPRFPTTSHERFRTAADKGKIFIYSGVDCNQFWPKVAAWWQAAVSSSQAPGSTGQKAAAEEQVSPVRVSDALSTSIQTIPEQPVSIEGDDEDRPPVIEYCLGREDELATLSSSEKRIFFITGIGGQGKSTLAARAYGERQKAHPEQIYVWRDCKEESERFENQLASVVESLSAGRVSGLDLAKQDIHAIVEMFIGILADRPALFVFDNIDHYIDLELQKLSMHVEAFVDAILTRTTQIKVFFTSRPLIEHPDGDVLTIPLGGISLTAARSLFGARSAKSSDAEISEAHALTNGHAFWLDLLAIQAAKELSPPLKQLVVEIEAGEGDLATKMLSSTWARLHDKQKTVLRAMAETVRPEGEDRIADYVRREMTPQKVFKALRNLRRANLVVVKRLRAGDEVLELHPLVRTFIRKSFSQKERLTFIDGIIRVYNQFLGTHRGQLEERPTFIVLQNWTQAAELSVNAGDVGTAYALLAESISPFMSSAYPREFVRVARLILSAEDFVEKHAAYKHFDQVLKAQTSLLSYLGEFAEVDSLLNRFALTVLNKDSRFILYCHMRAYTYWVRKSHSEAVEWGRRGASLKNQSMVDTEDDIEHTLALALRDGGSPDEALTTFLSGGKLEDATNPDEFDEERGGAYYGNTGRCLHFMGDLDGALVCYQKSALLIEKDKKNEHLLNQGFIRLWVAEIFVARRRVDLALDFFEAARRKWEQINPPEANRIAQIQEQLKPGIPKAWDRGRKAETKFQDWILGKLDQ